MTIDKQSLTDQVFEKLREKIAKQEIKFGEQISPKDIAAEYDISVMPVRDALLKLVSLGLVVNKPRVGFFVRSFTTEEIKEILEVRKMYELFCIRKHFSEIDLKKIRSLGKNLAEYTGEVSGQQFDRNDVALHRTIVEASHNEFLIKRHEKLINNFVILFGYLNFKRAEVSFFEHKELVNLILKGEQEKTLLVLDKHLSIDE